MNIAQGAAAHTGKAGGAAAAGHHHRGAGLTGQDAAGDTGFMALFSALGADDASPGLPGLAAKDADGTAVAALPVDGSTVFNGMAALDGSALATAQATLATLAAADATAAVSGATGDAPATAAASAVLANAAATTAIAGDPAAADAEPAANPGQAGVPANPAERRRPAGSARGDAELLRNLKAQAQALATAGDSAAATPTSSSAATHDTTAAGTAHAARSASAGVDTAQAQQSDAKLVADQRALELSRQSELAGQKPVGAEALVLAAATDGATREVQRAAERAGSKPSGLLADAPPGQPTNTVTATYDKPVVSIDSMVPATAEVQVAEQVSYWVSRDVQNAELKLDGLGANPVEVSISVVGNEAHVAFRSDQPEVRQVLENAMSHLKDMLQREGLTLTGTTVGSSGQGGQPSGQEQRGSGADVRQARMALANLASMPAARRLDATMGNAVDYFV